MLCNPSFVCQEHATPHGTQGDSSPPAVSHSEKDPDQAAAYTTEILKLQQLGYAVKLESNAETPSGLHLLFPIPHGLAQQEEHGSI